MALFLIASMPLLFLLTLWMPWRPGRTPEPSVTVGVFLKGVLVFFPGYLVILIARRIFGFSYDGFLLFLSLFLRDQLLPVLAALGGLLLMKNNLQLSGAEEENFMGVLSFLSGFLAMSNLADMVRTVGNWDAYVLFLLPILRIVAVLVLSLVARQFFPWEGRDALLFVAAASALGLGLAVPGFLDFVNRTGWSVLLTILPLLATIVAFASRFPRVLRA